MTKDQLVSRILSSEAAIDSQAFRTGGLSTADWEDLARASEVLAKTHIYLDDTSNITIPEMKAKIRRINQDPARPDIGLLIIDYLQLMSTGKRTENRVQEISEITRNLKIMAKELNVPVIALSQLSRSAEKNRTDHRPVLSDLRDSGSIEQDADVVLFLYRDAYYDNGEEADATTAECIVAKTATARWGRWTWAGTARTPDSPTWTMPMDEFEARAGAYISQHQMLQKGILLSWRSPAGRIRWHYSIFVFRAECVGAAPARGSCEPRPARRCRRRGRRLCARSVCGAGCSAG